MLFCLVLLRHIAVRLEVLKENYRNNYSKVDKVAIDVITQYLQC